MKINPQQVKAFVAQGLSNTVTKSRDFLRRFDLGTLQDANELTIYDESILQQSRFWMRTVTWGFDR